MRRRVIPREQNPYFLTGRGKKKVWFFLQLFSNRLSVTTYDELDDEKRLLHNRVHNKHLRHPSERSELTFQG
jgi:hypothetical protein